MSRYKIVFTDYYYPNNDSEIDILKNLAMLKSSIVRKSLQMAIKDEDRIIEYAGDADAIIVQLRRCPER